MRAQRRTSRRLGPASARCILHRALYSGAHPGKLCGTCSGRRSLAPRCWTLPPGISQPRSRSPRAPLPDLACHLQRAYRQVFVTCACDESVVPPSHQAWADPRQRRLAGCARPAIARTWCSHMWFLAMGWPMHMVHGLISRPKYRTMGNTLCQWHGPYCASRFAQRVASSCRVSPHRCAMAGKRKLQEEPRRGPMGEFGQ